MALFDSFRYLPRTEDRPGNEKCHATPMASCETINERGYSETTTDADPAYTNLQTGCSGLPIPSHVPLLPALHRKSVCPLMTLYAVYRQGLGV